MAEPSPQEQIGGMLTGYWVSQAVYVAAKLDLADLLKNGQASSRPEMIRPSANSSTWQCWSSQEDRNGRRTNTGSSTRLPASA
jgi:hypothetical protein